MTDLKIRIRGGETLIGVFADLASPLAVETAGRAGFDWAVLDLEHGEATEANLLAMIHAAEVTSIATVVRVPSIERIRIGRALDLGADGVMLPQGQSLDEVRAAAAWLRYPPVGVRGVALRTRGAGLGTIAHGDLAGVVNERVVGVVQVENPEVVAAADEIAALPEVDVLFVGPTDLTHNLGIPGRFTEPVYQEALQTVVAACERHGKAAGILLYDPAAHAPHVDLGFRFIGLGSLSAYVGGGAAAMVRAAGR